MLDRDRFKEPNDDSEEYSNCSQCDEVIMIGDYYYEHYGMIACQHINCLLKMTGTIERLAESKE